jgi:hypothetical protein
MRFSGNQPRIMQFGRVKIGDHYSVRPEATLGPTQKGTREVREKTRAEEWAEKRLQAEKTSRRTRRRVKEASNQEENSQFESRQFEGSRVDGSRVREFEISSSTVV